MMRFPGKGNSIQSEELSKNSFEKQIIENKPYQCLWPLLCHRTSLACAGIGSHQSAAGPLPATAEVGVFQLNRHHGYFYAFTSPLLPQFPLNPLPTPLVRLEDTAKRKEVQPRCWYAPATPLCCCRFTDSQNDLQ